MAHTGLYEGSLIERPRRRWDDHVKVDLPRSGAGGRGM
jgi:hypothetical protein